MAFYLVSAVPKQDLMEDLSARLARAEFSGLHPFGPTLSRSLKAARLRRDGAAIWEEEDYCQPPLAEERAAVLDRYFFDLRVEEVNEGEGWERIEALPRLFPEFEE
ncbi:MAG: hypothetical protein AB7V40_12100 [Methyloceanibacter sp.]